jgi:hypothetical protein
LCTTEKQDTYDKFSLYNNPHFLQILYDGKRATYHTSCYDHDFL